MKFFEIFSTCLFRDFIKGTITSCYVRDTLISRSFLYREIREINLSRKSHFLSRDTGLFRADIYNFIVEDVLGCLSVVTMTITSGNNKLFYGWSDAVTKRTQTFNFMPVFDRNFSIIGVFFLNLRCRF